MLSPAVALVGSRAAVDEEAITTTAGSPFRVQRPQLSRSRAVRRVSAGAFNRDCLADRAMLDVVVVVVEEGEARGTLEGRRGLLMGMGALAMGRERVAGLGPGLVALLSLSGAEYCLLGRDWQSAPLRSFAWLLVCYKGIVLVDQHGVMVNRGGPEARDWGVLEWWNVYVLAKARARLNALGANS